MMQQHNSTATRAQAFFWWCAGANRALLEQSPADHLKYTALGVMTCLAGGVASVSGGSFAAATLHTGPFASTFIGLAWGFVIFHLDRLLLVSMRKGPGEFKRAIPRFILALALALLIGEPLTVRLFKGEIDAELADNARHHAAATASQTQAQVQPQVDTAQATLTGLQEQRAQLQKRRDDAETAFIQEKEGTDGTKRPGPGPVYAEKLGAFNRAKAEYDAEKPELDKKITAQETALAALRQQITDAQASDAALQNLAKGGLAQHRALIAIVRRDPGAALIYIPLFLALLMLETLPLTTKLFSPLGRYDKLLVEADANGIQDVDWESDRTTHLRGISGTRYDTFTTRIFDAIAGNQRHTLTDAAEIRVAERLHAAYIERLARAAGVAAQPRAVAVPPITVEVTSHPQFQARLVLPGDEAQATLDDLASDLAQLADAIAASEGHAMGLAGATTVNGVTIDAQRPLWPQLAPASQLKLKFAALNGNGKGLPLP